MRASAHRLLTPPRATGRAPKLSRTGTARGAIRDAVVEGENEAGFEPRVIRLLGGAARKARGAGTRRDRTERDQARARRRVHSGIRSPRGPSLPPWRNADVCALRARAQERAVSRSVG